MDQRLTTNWEAFVQQDPLPTWETIAFKLRDATHTHTHTHTHTELYFIDLKTETPMISMTY